MWFRSISVIDFKTIRMLHPKVLFGENLPSLIFLSNSFAQVLEGSLIKWFADSQSAAKIVQAGSIKLDLHKPAVKVFQFCAEHNIRLEELLDRRTGDCFANFYTAKLLIFLFRFWNPG